MKLLNALSISLLLTASAQAQTNPVVTSVGPTEGPTRGGTAVTITGSGFEPNIRCFAPCPTTVTFDKTEVVPREALDTRLVVLAPPHAAGKVDLIVKVADGRSVTLPGAFTYTATTESAFTPILLPVYTDGKVAGANGSMWQTDLWLHNSGTSAMELAPWVCAPNQACPAIFPYRQALPAGNTIHNLPAAFRPPTANPSRIIYATREQAGTLAVQLRIADVTRSALNAGTELPAVREEALLVGPSDLLNVPFDAPFRAMLRIYDLQNTAARFRVSVLDQSEVSAAVIYSFEMEATTSDTGEFRTTAAYAQFNLDTLREQKRIWPAALRLRIEPLTASSRYWAFVSATNNDTQLVTTVSPQ